MIEVVENAPALVSHSFSNHTKDIDFLLWTRRNPLNYDKIKYNDSLSTVLTSSHFSPNLKTKILIHGYGDTGTTDWVIRVKDRYLQKGKILKYRSTHLWIILSLKDLIITHSTSMFFIGDYNVISVDWRRLANTAPFYNVAAANTKPVGYITADLISYIVNYFEEADIESFHPVGFSLGAHVAGHAGYHLDGRLSRITGLDPAGKIGFLYQIILDKHMYRMMFMAFVF